ncbi:MAG: helix-turn-helix domain-containing protein [Ignavibacteriaceae bacterium]|nr:helix-turn-helix domain-containing protein [Ignavibacteriaceae bacterium]
MSKQFSTQLNRLETLLVDIRSKESEFLNIEEASSFLRLKRSTLYSLVFKRNIPFYKRTKRLLFKKSELIEWVEQNKVNSLLEAQSIYSNLKGGY